MPPPRFRIRTLMIAVAFFAVLFFAADWSVRTYWRFKALANPSAVQLTLGSDDGLVAGHQLVLYANGNEWRRLRPVRVRSIEPDLPKRKLVEEDVPPIRPAERVVPSR